jgi:hypothetical protein
MTLVQGHEFPASVAPRLRSRVLGLGLMMLASAGAFWATRPHEHPHSFLLTLSSENSPSAIYFSAWNDGPVVATHDVSDGKTVVYRRNFNWVDGCTWQAVETLTPVGDRYYYYYAEHFQGCPAGQEPTGVPTPRGGYVSVTRLDGERTPTPPLATLTLME